MMTVLIFGILVGLDNLQIASAFGLMGINARRKWLMIFSFAFFEMVMPLVGLLIGNKLNQTFQNLTEWIGPGIMILLGLYILIREWREKEKTEIVHHKWLMVFLPLMMSFDNLMAGVGLGASGYPVFSTAVIVGICAGTLCFVGLFIGDTVRKWIPAKVEIISGLYLIAMAVFLIVKD
jgi:manganese efflux pump family protein